MNRYFRQNLVEVSGVRTISGGGTNASDAGQALSNLFGVSITGDQTISGTKAFALRPTINGTGVLLQGEAAGGSLQNVVFTTGDQTISGTKAFALRPTVNTSGLITSNQTVLNIIKLTQNEYNLLSPKDTATFYVIVG